MKNFDPEINRQELKLHDPDRYLISLFTSKERSKDLWSIFLFNSEIAKTRFVVTETALGLIRLQWWREEINKIYNNASFAAHPVLYGLEQAIRYYSLPKALFENLIYAREFDLEDVQPQGVQGIINYVELTTTPLNKLAVQIAGEEPSVEEIQKVSVRYSLVQLFRHTPKLEKQGFTLIDPSLIRELAEDKIHVSSFSTSSRILKAQNKMADLYLHQLAKCGYDVYHPKISRPPAFIALRVFINTYFSK